VVSNGRYQGHTDAQRNIGLMYRHGMGVPKDYQRAMEWLRKAADADTIRNLEKLPQLSKPSKGPMSRLKDLTGKWISS